MKHLIFSLTIGACLVLPSAGVVFATDPHIAPSANGSGQPGTGGVGIQCGPGMGVSAQPQPPTPPPGQASGGGGFANSSSPVLFVAARLCWKHGESDGVGGERREGGR